MVITEIYVYHEYALLQMKIKTITSIIVSQIMNLLLYSVSIYLLLCLLLYGFFLKEAVQKTIVISLKHLLVCIFNFVNLELFDMLLSKCLNIFTFSTDLAHC